MDQINALLPLKDVKFSTFGIQSVVDIITERIRTLILNGELKAGFRFPNENAFCELLGVGRSTLREAYKILEEEGVIERSKHGTRVCDISSSGISFSTAVALSDHRDLLEFRTMFEAETAYLAAFRASDTHIQELQNLLDAMVANKNNLLLLSYYDMKFHQTICIAAQNKLLINVMQSLSNTFEKSVYIAFQEDTENNTQQALFYHREILNAILRRDAPAAERSMRKHIKKVYNISFHNYHSVPFSTE